MDSQLALVTGASSGIGRAIAESLARRGHRPILVARDLSRLEQLADRFLVEFGVYAVCIRSDLSLPGAAETLHDELERRGFCPTIVVNCAAVGATGELAESPHESLSRMVQLNVESLVYLTRAWLPFMIQHGTGYILNVSSMVAAFPVPFMASYGATKAFVSSFTQALRQELAGTGVSVTELSPGVVLSGFQEAAGYELTAAERNSAMSSEEVGEAAVEAMFSRDALCIPGVMNAVAARLLALLPKNLASWATARFMRKTGRARAALPLQRRMQLSASEHPDEAKAAV